MLHEIKNDPSLRSIPVIIFSLGTGEPEVTECYSERANAYRSEPVDLEGSLHVVQHMERFWFSVAA